MALGTSHKLVEDTPSEVVRVSRLELNKLMDAVDTLVDLFDSYLDLVAAATDFADLKSDMTTATTVENSQALQDTVAEIKKVLVNFERPAAPASDGIPVP